MNSLEVYNSLKHLPVHSIGVYASDSLPLRLPPNSAIVVNTQPSYLDGMHWIAIYLDSNNQLEYFDSYGQPPLVQDHLKFIRRNCNYYTFNSQLLQSDFSSVCGHYCLCYLYFKTNGYSLRDFLSIFSTNVNKNDHLIKDVYKYLYCNLELTGFK